MFAQWYTYTWCSASAVWYILNSTIWTGIGTTIANAYPAHTTANAVTKRSVIHPHHKSHTHTHTSHVRMYKHMWVFSILILCRGNWLYISHHHDFLLHSSAQSKRRNQCGRLADSMCLKIQHSEMRIKNVFVYNISYFLFQTALQWIHKYVYHFNNDGSPIFFFTPFPHLPSGIHWIFRLTALFASTSIPAHCYHDFLSLLTLNRFCHFRWLERVCARCVRARMCDAPIDDISTATSIYFNFLILSFINIYCNVCKYSDIITYKRWNVR